MKPCLSSGIQKNPMKFFIVNKIINCLSLKGSQTKLSASSQANLCTSPKRILHLGKYNDEREGNTNYYKVVPTFS